MYPFICSDSINEHDSQTIQSFTRTKVQITMGNLEPVILLLWMEVVVIAVQAVLVEDKQQPIRLCLSGSERKNAIV